MSVKRKFTEVLLEWERARHEVRCGIEQGCKMSVYKRTIGNYNTLSDELNSFFEKEIND